MPTPIRFIPTSTLTIFRVNTCQFSTSMIGNTDSTEYNTVTASPAADAARSQTGGGSIEDSTNRPESPIYELPVALDRVRAAAEAARSLPFLFTLTGRAENYLWGRPDLRDTIQRLQAYQDAGADVLYAPGLTSKEEIAAVVAAVDRPVNVLIGLQVVPLSRTELSALGVKRISVGSALTRVALGAILRAAREMLNRGTFTFANEAASYRELNALFDSSGAEKP